MINVKLNIMLRCSVTWNIYCFYLQQPVPWPMFCSTICIQIVVSQAIPELTQICQNLCSTFSFKSNIQVSGLKLHAMFTIRAL